MSQEQPVKQEADRRIIRQSSYDDVSGSVPSDR